MNQKTRTQWRDKCDALWYQIQHERYRSCAVCGSPAIEIHHLISKNGHSSTRTDIKNGIGLCPAHHRGSELSPHGTPEKFDAWLKENRYGQWSFVQDNRNRIDRLDWKGRYYELKSIEVKNGNN